MTAKTMRTGGVVLSLLMVLATLQASGPATQPSLNATTPSDLPGLLNVVVYANGLYCGAVPEGDEGFASLGSLGIKTIISVDGAQPEVERATAHGMRYVHLPIGYDGMDKARTLQIARAVKELPHPIYIHCHHGKHRSAAAAGAVAVTLGLLSPTQAIEKLKVSGTAPNYTGLYQCVNVATLASADELATASNDFPEHWKTDGMVQTMVEVDQTFDHLKAVEKAGWKTPADHPDLVPAAEAGKLADLLRNLKDDEHTQARPSEFAAALISASKQAETLEEGISGNEPPATLSAKFKIVADSCKKCHADFRD